MKRWSCRSKRGWIVGMAGLTAAAVLGSAAAGPQRGEIDVAAVLARARAAEARIRSGRVLLTRTTENNPMTEQQIRERIKEPRALQVELDIARHMPRRVVERETVLFDNAARRLLSQTARKGGQMPAGRALYTADFFKTFNVNPQAPPEERNLAFIYKPRWPPYGPSDPWRGQIWSGWITAIRKRQILARSLTRDPRTGQLTLFLAGGPGAEMDQKLRIDPARGYTVSHLQAFDIKTGHLEFEERARYRRTRQGLWYPDRVVSTYYWYDAQGERHLSRRETCVVREARLNISLSEAAFAFPIPHGSFVQDDRQNPPLVYHEGVESPQEALRRRSEPRPVPLQVGQAAPAFELPALSGEKRSLAELRGKVVLVNMFALW